MNRVSDACLLVEVSAEGVSQISRILQKVIEEMGIESSPSSQNHHISIAYMTGEFSVDHLTDVAREIAESPLTLNFIGIEVLPGVTTDRDYIALKVGSNADLEYAIELIAENGPTKKFPNGFKSHMSILTVEKDLIEDRDSFARFLELKIMGMMSDIKLSVDGISIFSNSRQRIAQIPFS